MPINFHYAVQVCDVSNNQHTFPRICGTDRSLLSAKSVNSFCQSVVHAAELHPESHHHIMFFDDRSTNQTKSMLERAKKVYSRQNVIIEIQQISQSGIMNSISRCWQWLEQHGIDFVYQVQDDYIYFPTAIKDMVDMYVQIFKSTNTKPIILPMNDAYHWQTIYYNKTTPRTIFVGKDRYWIQIYDIPCCFMTHKTQFSQHWDLYNKFLSLPPNEGSLEADSLNWILTKKGVLAVAPLQSLALHIQSGLDIDPFVDWKKLWNSITTI